MHVLDPLTACARRVTFHGQAALFAGLRPTLLGIMPYSALSFAAFETLKALLMSRNLEAAAAERTRVPWATAERAEPHSEPKDGLSLTQKLAAGEGCQRTLQASFHVPDAVFVSLVAHARL